MKKRIMIAQLLTLAALTPVLTGCAVEPIYGGDYIYPAPLWPEQEVFYNEPVGVVHEGYAHPHGYRNNPHGERWR